MQMPALVLVRSTCAERRAASGGFPADQGSATEWVAYSYGDKYVLLLFVLFVLLCCLCKNALISCALEGLVC